MLSNLPPAVLAQAFNQVDDLQFKATAIRRVNSDWRNVLDSPSAWSAFHSLYFETQETPDGPNRHLLILNDQIPLDLDSNADFLNYLLNNVRNIHTINLNTCQPIDSLIQCLCAPDILPNLTKIRFSAVEQVYLTVPYSQLINHFASKIRKLAFGRVFKLIPELCEAISQCEKLEELEFCIDFSIPDSVSQKKILTLIERPNMKKVWLQFYDLYEIEVIHEMFAQLQNGSLRSMEGLRVKCEGGNQHLLFNSFNQHTMRNIQVLQISLFRMEQISEELINWIIDMPAYSGALRSLRVMTTKPATEKFDRLLSFTMAELKRVLLVWFDRHDGSERNIDLCLVVQSLFLAAQAWTHISRGFSAESKQINGKDVLVCTKNNLTVNIHAIG